MNPEHSSLFCVMTLFPDYKPTELRLQPAKDNRERRNQKIYARVYEIYDVRRIRWDDAIKKAADEYFLQPSTVEKIVSRIDTEKKKDTSAAA
jgi:hypothetical protein